MYGTKIFLTLLMLFFLTASDLFAQNDQNSVAESVDKQFEVLFESSRDYLDNKVVDLAELKALRENTYHQIETLENRVNQLDDTLTNRLQRLDSMSAKLSRAQGKVAKLEKSKHQFTVLGVAVSKGAYQKTVFIVVGILIIVLVVLIYRFRKGHQLVEEAQQKQEDLQRNFDEYRQKALETQQKLGRQLQDERNKNRGSVSDT